MSTERRSTPAVGNEPRTLPFSEWGPCQTDCCDFGDRLHVHGDERAYREWVASQPAAPPIDVEQLARAIRHVENTDPAIWLDHGDFADAIAAEYARLTRQEVPHE